MSIPIKATQQIIPSIQNGSIGGNLSNITPTEENGGNFGELLSNLVQSVNETHAAAGEAQEALLRGDPVELHQVIIAGSKAGIATDLLLEIRNRLVDGFNEIMRMPM